MKKWVRIVNRAAVVLLVVSGIFVAGVYGASEWKMARTYDITLQDLLSCMDYDAGQAERMARIVGCWAGCHGTRGEGGVEEIQGIQIGRASCRERV